MALGAAPLRPRMSGRKDAWFAKNDHLSSGFFGDMQKLHNQCLDSSCDANLKEGAECEPEHRD